MYKRKQYIINKSFQLRTTFSVIAFIFFVVAIIAAGIGIYANSVNKKIAYINEIEDNIVQALTVPSPEINKSNQNFDIEMAKLHSGNMATLKNLVKFNQWLIWIIVGVIFLQGVVLYFVLIRQTHRIAGPLFVMTRYMRDIINGTVPANLRPLRDKDLLKDEYKVFNDMVDALRERKQILTSNPGAKAVKKPTK